MRLAGGSESAEGRVTSRVMTARLEKIYWAVAAGVEGIQEAVSTPPGKYLTLSLCSNRMQCFFFLVSGVGGIKGHRWLHCSNRRRGM